MKESKRRNVSSFTFIFKYYVHRYIRLTPSLMIMIMISLNLSKYFGNGPGYPENGFEPNSLYIYYYFH